MQHQFVNYFTTVGVGTCTLCSQLSDWKADNNYYDISTPNHISKRFNPQAN